MSDVVDAVVSILAVFLVLFAQLWKSLKCKQWTETVIKVQAKVRRTDGGDSHDLAQWTL